MTKPLTHMDSLFNLTSDEDEEHVESVARTVGSDDDSEEAGDSAVAPETGWLGKQKFQEILDRRKAMFEITRKRKGRFESLLQQTEFVHFVGGSKNKPKEERVYQVTEKEEDEEFLEEEDGLSTKGSTWLMVQPSYLQWKLNCISINLVV